jgi:peroxiredoxin
VVLYFYRKDGTTGCTIEAHIFNAIYKMFSRNTFLISPEGKIAKVWTGVSPAWQSTEVLAVLPQLSR